MPGAFITNDLDTMFASSEFGEATGDLLYQGNPIPGIFDNEEVEAQNGEGEIILIKHPTITVKTSDVTGIQKDDAVVVNGTSYTVSYWMDDGTGVTTVNLELVA